MNKTNDAESFLLISHHVFKYYLLTIPIFRFNLK